MRGVGNQSRFEIMRDGKRVTLTLPLKAPPPPTRDDVRNLSGQHPFDGARVANLLPALAEELGLEEEEGQVVVMSVRNGSASANIFRPGDIIVRIGRETIESVNDLEKTLGQQQRLWQIVLKRGGRVLQFQLSG
jgi:S1-C subfamily serine protease